MSFLSKLQGFGRKGGDGPPSDAIENDLAFEGAFAGGGGAAVAAPTDLSSADPHGAVVSELPASSHVDGLAQSIITESVPSEIAEFSESRQQESDAGAAAGALPLIGNRPIAEQQRILAGLVGLSLLLLVVLTIMSIVSAGRGSAQVAATGQALMQSQRLAKSVSQALIGSPAAFPEVKESAEVLGRNVRGLKTGEGDIAAAPDRVQGALDPVVPLVERAEKNAATIVAQQKVLTQVSQSLRAINRQSSDLL